MSVENSSAGRYLRRRRQCPALKDRIDDPTHFPAPDIERTTRPSKQADAVSPLRMVVTWSEYMD